MVDREGRYPYKKQKWSSGGFAIPWDTSERTIAETPIIEDSRTEVVLWAHQTTWTTELTAEAEYENNSLENAAFRD